MKQIARKLKKHNKECVVTSLYTKIVCSLSKECVVTSLYTKIVCSLSIIQFKIYKSTAQLINLKNEVRASRSICLC